MPTRISDGSGGEFEQPREINPETLTIETFLQNLAENRKLAGLIAMHMGRVKESLRRGRVQEEVPEEEVLEKTRHTRTVRIGQQERSDKDPMLELTPAKGGLSVSYSSTQAEGRRTIEGAREMAKALATDGVTIHELKAAVDLKVQLLREKK